MSRRRKTEAHAETRRRGETEGGHSCPPNGGLGNSPAGENFVQTELGRLPADWSALPIRDVGEVITGRTPSTKREDFYNGEYNLISPADLDNGKYVVTAHKRLSEVGFKECRVLPKDSVLVGCIGNVGKLGMISDERSATSPNPNCFSIKRRTAARSWKCGCKARPSGSRSTRWRSFSSGISPLFPSISRTPLKRAN